MKARTQMMTGRIERHMHYPDFRTFFAAPKPQQPVEILSSYPVHPETYECEGRKLTHHRVHDCYVCPDSEGFIDSSIQLEGTLGGGTARDKTFMIKFDNGFNYTPEVSVSLCEGISACVIDKNALACKVRIRNETDVERMYKLKVSLHGQYE